MICEKERNDFLLGERGAVNFLVAIVCNRLEGKKEGRKSKRKNNRYRASTLAIVREMLRFESLRERERVLRWPAERTGISKKMKRNVYVVYAFSILICLILTVCRHPTFYHYTFYICII